MRRLSAITNYQDVQVLDIHMNQDEMHSLLSEIDVAYNGQMELQDYLQVNSKCMCLIYIILLFAAIRRQGSTGRRASRNSTRNRHQYERSSRVGRVSSGLWHRACTVP